LSNKEEKKGLYGTSLFAKPIFLRYTDYYSQVLYRKKNPEAVAASDFMQQQYYLS
jgi:hypothetical protein